MAKFTFQPTPLQGVILVEPTVWGDARGFFMESYARREFEAGGIGCEFVQDNHSCSVKGVLRGLHYQRGCWQAKLVRVLSGSVLDVAVDLRPESPTFGKWHAEVLSAENKRQLFIPRRFAHGFLTLEQNTQLAYKCDAYYDAQADAGILWSDPGMAIDWQLPRWGLEPDTLILSAADRTRPLLQEIDPETFALKG